MSRINNSFRLTGNLGAAPDIRQGPTGESIANLAIGVDSSYRNKTGDKVSQTDWFDLTVFTPSLVDVVQKYTFKGSKVQVRGRLRKRVWESKTRKDENGNPLMDSRYQLVVTEIMLLDRPRSDADPEPGTTFTAPAAPEGDDIDDDIPY